MSKAHDKITAKILELLDAGVVPWRKPWRGAEPTSLNTGKPYHGINYLVLGCAPYASPYWATFKAVKARGGHVRKGEKAWPIVFWKRWEKPTGELDENGEEVVKRIPILRYFNVFNLEQTEGVEGPTTEVEPREHEPIPACERIVSGMPHPPTITHGERRAYYRASTDTVNLPSPETFTSGADYYATTFHELVHSTGHASRLNRKAVGEAAFGAHDYGEEELTAEMGAAFLCGRAGISPAVIENQAAYIDAWRRRIREDRKLVVVAAGRATKAARYITGEHRQSR